MPRFPKFFDRGSLRRIGYWLLGLLIIIGSFYAWQPLRYDWIERKPDQPLSRLDLRSTGLFDPGRRVLIITAHPDDEAFYMGGTLFKLKKTRAKTTLVVLTDGDKGYYPFFDSATLAKQRQKETREAAERVGIEAVHFLEYPDGRLSFDSEPVDRLAALVIRLKPEIVLSYEPRYWPRVGHRDHRVGGEIAHAALAKVGFSGWSLYYHTLAPNTSADVGSEFSDSQDLLAVHASQFSGDKLQLVQAFIASDAQDAGQRFGTDFAEEFRAVRWPKAPNP